MSNQYEVLKHSPHDALSRIEQDFILTWFLHHMSMEQRYQMMQDHPGIYNKLMGSEIVDIVLPHQKQKAVKA